MFIKTAIGDVMHWMHWMHWIRAGKSSYLKVFLISLPFIFLTHKNYAKEPILDVEWAPDIEEWKLPVNEIIVLNMLGIEDQQRPKNCPIATRKPLELAARLSVIAEGLKSGPCRDRHSELVESMNNTAQILAEQGDRLSQISTEQANNTLTLGQGGSVWNPMENLTNNGLSTFTTRGSQIIAGLSQLPLDVSCMDHLKERGLLPSLAQISTGIGQVALMVPTPTGLMIGAGGVALGATLNLLKQLLDSPFNWMQSRDRKQFLDLNCAFFDARRQLDSRKYFKFDDEQWRKTVLAAKKVQKNLGIRNQNYERLKKQIAGKISNKKDLYLAQCLSLPVLTAKDSLLRLLAIMSKQHSDSGVREQFVDFFLAGNHPELLEAFALFLSERKEDFVLEILEELRVTSGRGLFLLDEDQFNKKYFQPIAFYTKELAAYSEIKHKDCLKRFGRIKGHEEALSNDDIEEIINKKVIAVDEYLQDSTQRLDQQLLLISSYEKLGDLDPFSEGAHQQFDLIQEYGKSKDIIYGKVGWSFLKYLLKEMEHNHKDFNSQFKKWNAKQEVAWACRDAEQTMKTWDYLNSSLELSYDFLDTNKGLMSQIVPKFRWFLDFIPSGYSYQNKLNMNLKAAEKAREILKKEQKPQKKHFKVVRKYRSWPYLNLGVFALLIKKAKKSRQRLQTFYEKNKCSQYL